MGYFPCLVRVFTDRHRDVAAAEQFFRRLSEEFGLNMTINRSEKEALLITSPTVSLHVRSDHPMLGSAREVLNRPPFCRVESVEFGVAKKDAVAAQSTSFWRSSNQPLALSNNLVSAPSSSPEMLSSSRIKEIVLPCGTESVLLDYQGKLHLCNGFEQRRKETPGIFSSPRALPGLDVRLFPAVKLGLTLLAPSSFITSSLSGRSQLLTRLGDDVYHISLPQPLSQAFCLQVTSKELANTFYSEGSDAVLDGTIPALQSTRVMGGVDDAGNVVADPNSLKGNCWQEAREIIKRPQRIVG